MLKPLDKLDIETRVDFLFKRVDAYDPETGAHLHESGGHTSKAPKWVLIYADCKDAKGNYRPYGEWRHIFRAWTLAEAIEHANAKLAKLAAAGKVGITEKLREEVYYAGETH